MPDTPSRRFVSHWDYHSGIQTHPRDEAVEALRRLPHPPAGAVAQLLPNKFTITFQTQTCAPNHVVTLRNDVDGWDRDMHGYYSEGAWHFDFDAALYPNGFQFKFQLDH